MPAAVAAAATVSRPPRRARDVAVSILPVLFRLGTDAVIYSTAAVLASLYCCLALEALAHSISGEARAFIMVPSLGFFVWLTAAAVPLLMIRVYERDEMEREIRRGKVTLANEQGPETKGAETLRKGKETVALIKNNHPNIMISIVLYGALKYAIRRQLEEISPRWRLGFILCDIACWSYLIITGSFSLVQGMANNVVLPWEKYRV